MGRFACKLEKNVYPALLNAMLYQYLSSKPGLILQLSLFLNLLKHSVLKLKKKRITKATEWEREWLSVPGAAETAERKEVLSRTEEVGGEPVGRADQVALGGH